MNAIDHRPAAAPQARSAASGLLAEFKRAAISNILRACSLFKGLPKEDLDTIVGFTVIKLLDRGESLFFEGDAAAGIYVLHRGAVKIYRVNNHGQEQVLHVARPIETFAEECVVGSAGHLANASAIDASQLLLVQRSGFLTLLKARPELALRVLGSMDDQAAQLVGLLDDLSLKDVKTRLANWLLQHTTDPNSRVPATIELPTTKRMLASELGATSETFSRTLKLFSDQRLISVGQKSVTLLSPFRLSEMLLQNLGEFPSKRRSAQLKEAASWQARAVSTQPAYAQLATA